MSLDLATLADGELATLSLAGRDGAFAEIVRRHRDALYRVALASLGDREDALDAVQETFIAAHRALRRFDTARTMRPWLARITLNRCRDSLRRRRVRRILRPFAGADDPVASVPDDRPGQDVEAADREELVRTMRAISRLPAAIREPIVLRTIEGLSQSETALALGITEKAVETRLRRARERLRMTLGMVEPGS
ncbi:RNA polymerase sigma factor SigM [soil metagenome]|uniref:RNA polymerase sigma factor n=1 Tax=Parasphingomonas halimpatiens TaxID=3096162 RepID=UPI002481346A|nr:RNA polymerase sigma factor [Sphingomonas sp. AR_OL41]MDH7972551.1 RNA polymerase sigma factor [Sphingomonas sp. AR_OL41]